MRQADIVCALCLLALAGMVAWESLRLDIGWGLNGPAGGFFPFWLAVGLGLCCLIIFAQAVRHDTTAEAPPLVKPGGWKPVLQVVLPAAVMVALAEFIGLYLATALYLAFYMRRIGRYHWGLVLVVSLGVPLVSYFVFERWLFIPMPKGVWGVRLGL